MECRFLLWTLRTLTFVIYESGPGYVLLLATNFVYVESASPASNISMQGFAPGQPHATPVFHRNLLCNILMQSMSSNQSKQDDCESICDTTARKMCHQDPCPAQGQHTPLIQQITQAIIDILKVGRIKHIILVSNAKNYAPPLSCVLTKLVDAPYPNSDIDYQVLDQLKQIAHHSRRQVQDRMNQTCVIVFLQTANDVRLFREQKSALDNGGFGKWMLVLNGGNLVPVIPSEHNEGVLLLSILTSAHDSTPREFRIYDKLSRIPGEKLSFIGSWTPDTGLPTNHTPWSFPYGFGNIKLRVTSKPYDIFQKREIKDGKLTYGGLCFDILNGLATTYNFSYSVQDSVDGKWGALDNGTWDGMIGMLVRKTADAAVAAFTVSGTRAQAVDFPTSFQEDPGALLYYVPPTDDKLLLYLRPFKPRVWLATLMAIPCVAALIVLFMHFGHSTFPVSTSTSCQSTTAMWVKYGWDVWGFFIAQGTFFYKINAATRFAAAFWFFFAIVMVATYQGNLVSFLVAEKTTLLVKGVEDIPQQSTYKVGTLQSTHHMFLFKNSTKKIYSDVWKVVQQDPANLVTDEDAGIEKVLEGNYILMYDKSFLSRAASKHCNLTVAPKTYYPGQLAVALQKNSPYSEAFSEGIARMKEGGLIHQWRKSIAAVGQTQKMVLNIYKRFHGTNVLFTQSRLKNPMLQCIRQENCQHQIDLYYYKLLLVPVSSQDRSVFKLHSVSIDIYIYI